MKIGVGLIRGLGLYLSNAVSRTLIFEKLLSFKALMLFLFPAFAIHFIFENSRPSG